MTRTEYQNRPLAEALSGLRGQNDNRRYDQRRQNDNRNSSFDNRNKNFRPRKQDFATPVNNLGDDGHDHINVHFQAVTAVGRGLSVYGDFPFTHPKYGRFRTVHGLMCWLGHPNQPDSFRNMEGWEVERQRINSSKEYIHQYRFVLIDSTYQKIMQNPDLLKMVKDCADIPFDHYYMQTTSRQPIHRIRVRTDSYSWIIRGLTEVRKAILENRIPRLDFLLHPSDRAEYLENLAQEAARLENVFNEPQEVKATDDNKDKKFKKHKKRFKTDKTTTDTPVDHQPTAEAIAEPIEHVPETPQAESPEVVTTTEANEPSSEKVEPTISVEAGGTVVENDKPQYEFTVNTISNETDTSSVSSSSSDSGDGGSSD